MFSRAETRDKSPGNTTLKLGKHCYSWKGFGERFTKIHSQHSRYEIVRAERVSHKAGKRETLKLSFTTLISH